MITENRSYNLFTYNSWFLVLSMVGFGVLGAGILWIFQRIIDIPFWVQYIFLTLWLAADFLFSSYAAAKPTVIKFDERELTLESNLETIKVPWTDVHSFKFSDELLLISIKFKLKNTETISIIDFKWRGKEEFYAFLQSIYSFRADDSDEELHNNENKIESFLKTNSKTILGIVFFMVYVSISSNLDDQGAFSSWNPIAIYFYWVLPVITFFKLVFTQ